MVGYYRLKELGFRLSSGAHILPKEQFEPVEAAAALLEEARSAAARIVEEAQEEFERERARGHEEGLARARLEVVEWLLGERALLEQRLTGIEEGLAEVVFTSVRRLVDGFDDRQKAESMVRKALQQMRREKRAELRVSPAQHAQIKASIDTILKDFPEVELVDVVEDATLCVPQIILETGVGRIEGDIGRSLDELERIVRNAVGGIQNAPEAAVIEGTDSEP